MAQEREAAAATVRKQREKDAGAQLLLSALCSSRSPAQGVVSPSQMGLCTSVNIIKIVPHKGMPMAICLQPNNAVISR